MTITKHIDILVIGGGIAGLIAAHAFHNSGKYSVLCADPSTRKRSHDDGDLRSTAILEPGLNLLDEIGLWQSLASISTPLKTMRIASLNPARQIESIHDFQAGDIGEPRFGVNLQNHAFLETLANALPAECDGFGMKLSRLTPRKEGVIAEFEGGERLHAKLIIGADGRESKVREEAGIGISQRKYGQSALVFTVAHPEDHEFTSTEFHEDQGPFTLVPIAEQNGRFASAVVWMTSHQEAHELSRLSDADLGNRASERSAYLYGSLEPISKRAIWPILWQRANTIIARRTALIAEAAHVVPPIGAQGLNMSLHDIAELRNIIGGLPSKEMLGEETMLEAYAKKREMRTRFQMAGIDLLNRAAITSHPLLRKARAEALKALHGISPIRRKLMHTGLGRQ